MRIVSTQPAPRPSGHDRNRPQPAPVREPGRALATPRDVALFRTAELPPISSGAPASFLAQRLAQLWPVEPLVMSETATAAYASTAANTAHVRPASMVA